MSKISRQQKMTTFFRVVLSFDNQSQDANVHSFSQQLQNVVCNGYEQNGNFVGPFGDAKVSLSESEKKICLDFKHKKEAEKLAEELPKQDVNQNVGLHLLWFDKNFWHGFTFYFEVFF